MPASKLGQDDKGTPLSENQIRNAIAEYLIYNGFLVLRINSGAAVVIENGKRRWINYVKWFALGEEPQTAGVSDLLAIHPDPACPPLVVEAKVPGNQPTEAQRRFMAQWIKHGGIAVIAYGIEDVQRVLSQ